MADSTLTLASLSPLFHTHNGKCCSKYGLDSLRPFLASSEPVSLELDGFPNCHLRTKTGMSLKSSVNKIKFEVECRDEGSLKWMPLTVRVASEEATTSTTAVCMKSSLLAYDVSPFTFHLDSLRLDDNAGQHCPSGRRLLALHEMIAKEIGAKKSQLTDVSYVPIWQTKVGMLKIRSIVLNTLLSPFPPSASHPPSSYYSQHGYHISAGALPVIMPAMVAAAAYLWTISIDSVVSQIQPSITFRRPKEKLEKYRLSESHRTFSSLIRKLHSSSNITEQVDCLDFLQTLIAWRSFIQSTDFVNSEDDSSIQNDGLFDLFSGSCRRRDDADSIVLAAAGASSFRSRKEPIKISSIKQALDILSEQHIYEKDLKLKAKL